MHFRNIFYARYTVKTRTAIM